MPRAWTLAVVVSAATLICAESASAYTQQQLDSVLAFARAQWPNSPCAGREQVSWSDAGVDAAFPGAENWGASWMGSCSAAIAVTRIPTEAELACTVTHELGHLAGFYHDALPNSWMNPDMPRLPDCQAAFPDPTPVSRPAPTHVTRKHARRHKTRAKCARHGKRRHGCRHKRSRRR